MTVSRAWLLKITRYEKPLIVLAVIVLFLTTTIFSLWKLAAFSYNALDLAIFHQVIARSSQGDLFGFTIHPHSYLGDHVDFFLLLLAPFYTLIQHPAVLLVLQAAAVSLAVWPLFLLTRTTGLAPAWRVLLTLLYCSNAAIHNAVLFEFHTLVFAIPLLFLATLAYAQHRLPLYLLALFFTLIIREDTGLVLMGLGLMAWFDRRPWIWKWLPIAVGMVWFFGGTFLAGLINEERYKFVAYFGWLGTTPQEIFLTLLTQPWLVVLRILRPQNILFLVVMMMLFAGLPLLRMKRLLPIIFVLAALLTASTGGDELTLKTHYPALLLPFFFWATAEAIQKLQKNPPRFLQHYRQPQLLAAIGLGIIMLYGFFTLSSLRPQAWRALAVAAHHPDVQLLKSFRGAINPDQAIATSYRLLPEFGQHPSLISLHYVFTGRRQLSTRPYTLPDEIKTILFDSRDILYYTLQFSHDPEKFQAGDNRLRTILEERDFQLVAFADSLLLWQQDVETSEEPPYVVGLQAGRAVNFDAEPLQLVAIDGQDEQLRIAIREFFGHAAAILPINLVWRTTERLTETYDVRLQFVDTEGHLRYERRYPITYGLFPTTEWKAGVPITVRYRWLVPPLAPGNYTVQLQLGTIGGFVSLDEKLSAVPVITSEKLLGKPKVLGSLSF